MRLGVLLLTATLAGQADAQRTLWETLYPDDKSRTDAQTHCAVADSGCALAWRYREDAQAAALAKDLWEHFHDVAGVERDWMMDGGYRGNIRIVGELPVDNNRKHLAYVHDATVDLNSVLTTLLKDCPKADYRWTGLSFRFFRSVKRQTPSAYASGWTIAYNLAGSMNTSADGVRETLFHELFHLNDQAHGNWSETALATLHASLKTRCHDAVKCLKPFSPSETRVKGGNWYAFHKDNGPSEYAAELALRFYREQRAIQNGDSVVLPFKCMTTENALAWKLLSDKFFCGRDLVPACR